MPESLELKAYQQAMCDMAQEYGRDYLCELEFTNEVLFY